MMVQNWSQIYLHFVGGTNRRDPVLDAVMRPRVYAALTAKCRELRCEPIAIGGLADHVHVLLRSSPTLSPAYIAKMLKGSSSHLVNHALGPSSYFQWQGGYGVLSVSKKHLQAVQAYILTQETRHLDGKISPFLEASSEVP